MHPETLHVYDRDENWVSPLLAQFGCIPGVVQLSNVTPQAIDWLWPGRFPAGQLSLLIGDSAVGKSLVALDIAARVSRGAAWPDAPADDSHAAQPAPVVLLTAEDGLANIVRPRLEALGADCSQIYAFSTLADVREKSRDEPDDRLSSELQRLRELLDALPRCRLVIVDPITAYLAGSENSSVVVRALLHPLAALARKRGVAVIAVCHLRKKDGSALYRTAGSQAFVNLARSVWLVARDVTCQDRRLLIPVKCNLANAKSAIAFSIDETAIADDGASASPRVHWSADEVDAPAVQFAVNGGPGPGRPDHERDHAIEWLREALANGPRLSLELRTDAAECGIAFGTLVRAFRAMGGKAVRSGGPRGFWRWELPVKETQNSGG